MKMRILSIIFILVIACAGRVRADTAPMLCHIAYEQPAHDSAKKLLEIAKIQFYFSGTFKMQVQEHAARMNGSHRAVKFFFPHATVSPACASIVARMNGARTATYTLQTEVSQQGVTITIAYDTAKMVLDTKSRDMHEYSGSFAGNPTKEVVILLYNKEHIEKLKHAGDTLLRTAAVTQKTCILNA
jgi:hypothetical protein